MADVVTPTITTDHLVVPQVNLQDAGSTPGTTSRIDKEPMCWIASWLMLNVEHTKLSRLWSPSLLDKPPPVPRSTLLLLP